MVLCRSSGGIPLSSREFYYVPVDTFLTHTDQNLKVGVLIVFHLPNEEVLSSTRGHFGFHLMYNLVSLKRQS